MCDLFFGLLVDAHKLISFLNETAAVSKAFMGQPHLHSIYF